LHIISSFFYHSTPPSVRYALSLHDALPISVDRIAVQWAAYGIRVSQRGHLLIERPERMLGDSRSHLPRLEAATTQPIRGKSRVTDRKSTRLNSSHQINSYAVFCLKKKN